MTRLKNRLCSYAKVYSNNICLISNHILIVIFILGEERKNSKTKKPEVLCLNQLIYTKPKWKPFICGLLCPLLCKHTGSHFKIFLSHQVWNTSIVTRGENQDKHFILYVVCMTSHLGSQTWQNRCMEEFVVNEWIKA